MNDLPYWIQVTSALLTPTVAIAAGVIGWLQWRTNETKRKQDLFDRRFDVFKRAASGYSELWSEMSGTTSSHEWRYFCIEAGFLFGPDIVQHLKTMDRKREFDLEWFAEPFKRYMQFK